MELGAFIGDGQAESGYVAPVKGLHPACRFTFRPCTVEQRSAYSDGTLRMSLAEANKCGAKLIAGHLVSWEFDPPPTAPAVAKLRPRLYERLLAIVLGLEASDDDPEAKPEEREESAEDKFRRELEQKQSLNAT